MAGGANTILYNAGGATVCKLSFNSFASRVVCISSPRSHAGHQHKDNLKWPYDQYMVAA